MPTTPPTTLSTTLAPTVTVTPAPTGDAAPMPLWPEVKTGTLANGMRYFILKHGKPEKRALLWLAVNAGSILEDDDQRGLAHFDEHMAFNGTKHFPKQAIVNYLESIGMRFGADLNAYTSFDETVYQLEVPTDKPEFIAKGLDILRDWAGDVTFDHGEINAERGVVREEWRLGRGAQQRLFDKQAKVLFKGSRYADRLTIGDVAIIDKAPPEALVRFYKDWYRPDLMAVVVVGEIDPATISAEIEKRFSDLKNPTNPRPRIKGEVPVADGMRVSIETDREAQGTNVAVYNVMPTRPRTSLHDDRRLVVEQLYAALMSDRFVVLHNKPDAPFLFAGTGMQPVTRTIDAFARFAIAKQGRAEDALRMLFTEVVRVERHGFTQSELDRARKLILHEYEENETIDATSLSRNYAQEIIRYFLEHELMIGRKAENELAKRFLPTITVEELNQLAASYSGAQNRVVLITGPDGKPLTTEANVLKIIDEVNHSDVAAWDEKPTATTLLSKEREPKSGTIVSEKKLPSIEVTEWVLSNGIRVVVKPSDYAVDNVLINGMALGGDSQVKDADYFNAQYAARIVEAGGIGALDPIALNNLLSGKDANVTIGVNETHRTVTAGGAAHDLETILQLLYLRVTEPRRDEAAIATLKATFSETMTSMMRAPQAQFLRQAVLWLYNNNLRRRMPEPTDLDKVSTDKAFAFYHADVADMSGYTFVIVGAVDLEKLKPLVEKYLASLPGKPKSSKAKANANANAVEHALKIHKLPGVVKKEFKIGEAPQAMVHLEFHGDEAWTRDKDRDIYVLGQVLSIRLRENLREAKGGVYGVRARGTLSRSGLQEYAFTIDFGCDPARVDELIGAVLEETKKLATDGPNPDYLNVVRETFLRVRETELRSNSFWLGWLANSYRYGDDPTIVLDPTKLTARITVANVKAAATKYLDIKQYFQAVMLPATPPAAPPAK